jgi:hypothetical protein
MLYVLSNRSHFSTAFNAEGQSDPQASRKEPGKTMNANVDATVHQLCTDPTFSYCSG